MVKENAIIKNLNSVESLGCVSVICSDKTGTLTQNKMTPQTIYFYNHLMKISELDNRHHDHSVLLKSCLLCNNAVINGEQRIGDPTELALIDLVHEYTKNDIEFKHTAVRTSELPFDSDRKLMSISSLNHIYTKGAPDVIIKRCSTILINGIKEPITKRHLDAIEKENQRCANNGLRVLGFAYKDYRGNQVTLEDEHDLTFIGLVSLMDPPRIESQDAVAKCKIAGIKPIMITGDHVVTARAIATQIGIYEDGDLSIEGYELDKMSEEELDEKLPHISVYARVAPEHKIRIVIAWQKRGDIVAMTGDGVNDVMALKEADCSIVMGSGSQACKSVASLVLLENQMNTLPVILYQGRCVINNIQRTASLFLVKTIFSIALSLLTLVCLKNYPFKPIQLTLISALATGIPSFILTLEPNGNIVKGNFLRNVISKALPGAICVICSVIGVSILGHFVYISPNEYSTMCTILAGVNALMVLVRVCVPMTTLRKILVTIMCMIFVGSIILCKNFFYIVHLRWYEIIYVILNICLIPHILTVVSSWIKLFLKQKNKVWK